MPQALPCIPLPLSFGYKCLSNLNFGSHWLSTLYSTISALLKSSGEILCNGVNWHHHKFMLLILSESSEPLFILIPVLGQLATPFSNCSQPPLLTCQRMILPLFFSQRKSWLTERFSQLYYPHICLYSDSPSVHIFYPYRKTFETNPFIYAFYSILFWEL